MHHNTLSASIANKNENFNRPSFTEFLLKYIITKNTTNNIKPYMNSECLPNLANNCLSNTSALFRISTDEPINWYQHINSYKNSMGRINNNE